MSDLPQLGAWNVLLVKQEDGIALSFHYCLCSTVKQKWQNYNLKGYGKFINKMKKRYISSSDVNNHQDVRPANTSHLLARLVVKTYTTCCEG